MRAWRRIVNGAMIRRGVQAAALLLFVGLVVVARPARLDVAPPPWLQSFFLIDPLILVLTWLSAHAVPALLLLALITLGVTVLLGRVFCGWICPLGTIHALAARFFDLCWPKRKRGEHWSPWQLAKYYILVGLLVMAAWGVRWGAVFDPLVLLYRTTTVALLPGAHWTVQDASRQFDPAGPTPTLRREKIAEVADEAFLGSGLILLLLLGMLALNRYRRRFWCRYLCPLGALLGIFALRPLLRRRVDRETCNECDVCGLACHGAATAVPGDQWKAAECFGCLNCTPSCARGSLRFRWTWPWQGEPKPATPRPVSRSRRRFLRGLSGAAGAAVGGLAGLFLLRANPQSRNWTFHPALIRPPGALPEPEFLKRCTACGLCMRVCPTGGLQPALSEAGLEGLWTPRLVPRIGFCNEKCNLCGQVCPTGAIQPLPLEEKQKVRIGLAVIDTTRCIPYAYALGCGTCVECCPLSPKALYMVSASVENRAGDVEVIKQPRVDPDRCIGCGRCEFECPFGDLPAIRVTSANESRHYNPDNLELFLPPQEG
jgi:MauM/NapG family ferredoxin protein